MKQPKRLTYEQKRLLDKNGLDPNLYMFAEEKDGKIKLWNKMKKVFETYEFDKN